MFHCLSFFLSFFTSFFFLSFIHRMCLSFFHSFFVSLFVSFFIYFVLSFFCAVMYPRPTRKLQDNLYTAVCSTSFSLLAMRVFTVLIGFVIEC
jgi:hypothetical protein